ncbi:MAG: type transport system permease protein [Gaiellaceae bacterium]|nr:type transport system permease protein [Gaiellaceae bacterium]
MSALRVIWSGFTMNLKMLGTSGFFLLTSTVQPVVFATVAFYMFKSGGRSGTLLYAALGAGMMGVWSTTLFGSGGMIQWQRWQGTLELGVAAPPPMALVYLPFSLANAFTGMYALAATLLWGRIAFGVPLHLAHPWLFALALPTTVVGLGLMGLVLASTFVLYRNANALSNLLEYPVWIASGLVFSTAICRAGRARSRGRCRRTGACSRSGTRHSAGRSGCRSRWWSRSESSTARSRHSPSARSRASRAPARPCR